MALAGSGWFAYPAWRQRCMALLLGYGGLIEILQMFIPNRSAQWGDMVADAVGIGIGCLLAVALQRATRHLRG